MAKEAIPEDLNRLSDAVIGAAVEVHRTLGPGFLESIYAEALCAEFSLRGISFQREVVVPVKYKGTLVGEHRLDLLVEGRLVLELKSVDALTSAHKAQVLSYLKASGCRLGLLVNFGAARLIDGIKRLVN
jgi:GxxExxY protein